MNTESPKHARFDREDGTVYDSPTAVVDDASLPHDEKHSILAEWKRRVAEENRADGIDTLDHTLDIAIRRLAGLRT